MKTRTLVGLLITLFIVGAVLLRLITPVLYDLVVVLLAVMCGLEMMDALKKKFAPPVLGTVLAFPILAYVAFFLIWQFTRDANTAMAGVLAAAVLCIVVTLVVVLTSKLYTKENLSTTLFIVVYPMGMLCFMLYLNHVAAFGTLPLALLFFISCFTDIFALLVGRTLKGPKLAPKISPNKTVSGAVGGLFGGLLGAGICFALVLFSGSPVVSWLQLPESLSPVLWKNILHFVLIGLIGSAVSQLGDLLASYVKRIVKIKDYGTIMPGHGGFMDRFDGVILNTIFLTLYFLGLSLYAVLV
jgi:phosphatidate cytidylyltransferase